jgi:hypothetical protein
MSDTTIVIAEATLAELEAIIDRGKQTFVEVGNALTEIRERKLHREAGFATFEDYCQRRHGFTASRGRQLIAAAATVTAVTLSGGTPPATEREARSLARERREERWSAPGGGRDRAAAEREAWLAARYTPAEPAARRYIDSGATVEERERRTLEGASGEEREQHRLLWHPTPAEAEEQIARNHAQHEDDSVRNLGAELDRVFRQMRERLDAMAARCDEADLAELAAIIGAADGLQRQAAEITLRIRRLLGELLRAPA